MKRISLIFSIFILLLALILLSNTSQAEAAGSNIGVVNMQKVIAMSNQGKKANSILHSLVVKYKAKLSALKQKITTLHNDLKQNSSIMSSSEKLKKTKEFETDIANFSSEEKHVQGVISEKRFNLLKGIVAKINVIINNIAKQKGYIIVIDRPDVVYRVNSIDITNQVLSQMNSK
ncbi:MAG: OmpH family outer membrane protein [Candidatus Acididesulfobacter diazotrophicus]|jgi:outer membrane protein|uniref:OmpH family outer membrane protein n=1 Tax=Candidatus Acididesulfobacter diazotrophicus TaxID=2597226 RepID=A0A519BMC1_9DELT|nr:MAG: OmpH family outer membrane protein [Candidatus Acididesulfobacter diazotrophicus]